jgi:hypothetical protein
VRTQLRVHNAGRRYVRASLATPTWLAAAASAPLARKEILAVRGAAAPPTLALDLQPGQEIGLFLAPITSRYSAAEERGAILLRADRQIVAKVPVSGTSVPVPQLSLGRPRSSAQGNDAMMLFFVVLAVMIFAVVMTLLFP